MIHKLADNRDPRSLAARLRQQRMKWLEELLEQFSPPVRILDVGGTAAFWRLTASASLPDCQVTLLNLQPQTVDDLPGAIALSGDVRQMPQFGDRAFDLCFSNSLIEHVGTLYDQQAAANEIRRVARGYFVQAPYRHFPIEPHFLVPGWQYLPTALRASLLNRFTLGWMARQPNGFLARAEVEQVRLLNRREFHTLFPDATIRLERFGPFVKSLVAVKHPDR